MASVSKSTKMDHSDNNYASNPDLSAAEAALKAKLARKRTKTGCLTCRKRRIKCGEERPTCRNCIKSKRHCEGYNPRVVFRPPNIDYRPVANGAAHITFQAGPVPAEANQYPAEHGEHAIDPAYQSYFRPRAIEHYAPGYTDYAQRHTHLSHHPPEFVQLPHGHPPHPPPPQQGYVLQSSFANQPQHMGGSAQPHHELPIQSRNAPNRGYPPTYGPQVDFLPHSVQGDVSGATQPPIKQDWHPSQLQKQEQTWELSSPTDGPTVGKISPTSTQSSKTLSWSNPPGPEISQSTWSSGGYTPRPELCRPIDYQPPPISSMDQYPPHTSNVPPVEFQTYRTPEYYDYENHEETNNTPNYLLKQAAIETQDDDYYDVDSDEEMETDHVALTSVDIERQRNLNRILERNNISIQELQTRRYDTFIYDGSLDHYRAEETASPLKNPATARVFAHFISVTGPSLSIYERHPRNTSVLFTEGQVPFSQQGLWTYTLPVAALHHHGLLHAMLALASLHIARLRNASLTPSMQHYAWALKRIHSCVSHEKKRSRLTTIAATMLLGFYEVITADHMKWNMHLAGSKQLFQETDFVTMTQQFRSLKGEREMRRRAERKRNSGTTQYKVQDEILDQIHDVDERVVSQIVGREVRYDDFGCVVPKKPSTTPPLDLSKFAILKDLYWWYIKQDVYQSIISGNALLLDYSRWANCPPRAPLGKADAVYGSFDHLMLLLGRIADFAARDRHRKLRQMEANGGQWRPPPGMKMPGPPPSHSQPLPTPVSATNGVRLAGTNYPPPPPQPPQPPSGPLFYGMAPAPRQNVQMPASYNPMNGILTPDTASPNDSLDLHTATNAALEEYGRIRSALHAFSTSLGDQFAPLTSDEQPPLNTPFGPALFYRSYDIGCLWAIYHMAMIIAIRSHPHMHPAAHAAAAIAANETVWFAREIGRIAAGIVPTSPDQPLNPALGAALCESCMPSFFAAIQYQSTEERHHTVLRIYSIAKRTGWGSAELIANGCETAWVKAAQAGRGPQYTRVVRPEQSDDPRLNGSWETLDPNAPPDEKDDADRRLVTRRPEARLNWAIGVMGMEDDEMVLPANSF